MSDVASRNSAGILHSVFRVGLAFGAIGLVRLRGTAPIAKDPSRLKAIMVSVALFLTIPTFSVVR